MLIMRENGVVMKLMRFVVIAVLGVVVLAAQTQPPSTPQTAEHNIPALSLSGLSSSLESLVTRVRPAVVQIFSTGYTAAEENDATTTSLLTKQHSIGTGVVVGEDGYVITNAHVVRGARLIQVRLSSLRRDQPTARLLPAKLVGMDREIAVAVLRI